MRAVEDRTAGRAVQTAVKAVGRVGLSRQVHEQSRRESARRLQTSPRRAHDLLRSSIRAGLIGSNSLLIEDALVRSLSTSRNAVRQALQMLAQEGLVERRPHHGTNVVGEILEVAIEELVPACAFDHTRATIQELEHRQIPADGYVAERLMVGDGLVDVAEYLILFDGEPMSLRASYIPVDEERVERVCEVVPVPIAFERVFGIPIGTSETVIEAVAASGSASRLLGVPEGAPLLLQELLLRDIDGRPRELSYTHYRGGRVSLAVSAPPPLGAHEGSVVLPRVLPLGRNEVA